MSLSLQGGVKLTRKGGGGVSGDQSRWLKSRHLINFIAQPLVAHRMHCPGQLKVEMLGFLDFACYLT